MLSEDGCFKVVSFLIFLGMEFWDILSLSFVLPLPLSGLKSHKKL